MGESVQQQMFSDAVPAGGECCGAPRAVVVRAGAAWLPDEVSSRLRRGVPYPVRFSRAERKILRKRKKERVSGWAEKHRHLTMSSIQGPWRNEVTPYLTGIMDGAQYPSVRVIAVRKCPQSGVTEAVHNFVGWAIDQDPGPVLYTFPDKDTSDENARDRILPMIKSSRRLRGYMTGTRNDESMMRINLAHMPIYLSWASSPARLGNKPIKFAIADETDKYESRSKKETGPMYLIDKRLTVYRQVSKFFKISTPTGEKDIISRAVDEDAEVVFHYWVRCPACGWYQLMRFANIKFLEDCRDAKTMRAKNLAKYACTHCDSMWDDHMRNKAVGLGEWRSQGPDDERGLELHAHLEKFRPANIAFQLPAWIPRFNSLSDCAAAFLESLDGGLHEKRNFHNQIRARPYRFVAREIIRSEYRSARCDLPPGVVPEIAVALTCGIDCQKSGFYYVVRAWARDYTSWLVEYSRLHSWEDVEDLVFVRTFPVYGATRKMRIARAAVDTGGSKFDDYWMTEEAYWWLRKNGVGRGARCRGVKGASWHQANKVKMGTPMDKTPSGKPIPGGLQIVTLDTEKFKDAFFHRMDQAVEKGELAAYLHAETGRDYFGHISAEHKVENEKGVLQWKRIGSRRNDWLDCEVYAAAAADPEWPEGGIHLMVPPGKPSEKSQEKASASSGRDRRTDRKDGPESTETGRPDPEAQTGSGGREPGELPSWIRNM